MSLKNIKIIFFFLSSIAFSQENAFKDGEWLSYRMSYSKFLKAGTATFELKEEKLNGKKVYHSIGKGSTSGLISWFFKVKDNYQSYFDKNTGQPYLFKRKVNEGGYKIQKEIRFDYTNNEAKIKNLLHKKDTTVFIKEVQDMISVFYYLRSQNIAELKQGESVNVNMFFDEKTFPFKLKFIGTEVLKTKFGKIKTYKFTPLVQAGRVFKEQESVTVWVTADANKVPIKVKASLSVGSLQAELEEYKGLANSFKILVD